MGPIETTDLTKHYGEVVGIDTVSLSVESGEVFGFLGPNGAGKTTAIRTVLGFQSPTAGSARVLGADVRDESALVDAKRRIGYLPSNPSFDGTATGREVLDLHASIKGDERSDELLELFRPPLDREIREYSTGNVQKLGLVQAFMHDPDLVILDEPTSGLDPLLQRRFEEFLRAESDDGTTAFISSHVLGEVRRVCDRIGILREGKLVAIERVEDLLHRNGKAVHVRVDGGFDRDRLAIAGVHDLTVHGVDGSSAPTDAIEASFTYTGDVGALLDAVRDLDPIDLTIEEAPLEDVFARFYDDERAGVESEPEGKASGTSQSTPATAEEGGR